MDSKRRWFTPLLVCIGFCLFHFAVAQRTAEYKCEEYIAKITYDSYGGYLSTDPNVQKFSSTNCSTSVDLIVGGEEALVGEFPHQAVLGYLKQGNPAQIEFKCGGSLISENFVLTAAHCGRPKIVRLREHDLYNDKDGQQDFEVANFTHYPEYKSVYSYHDIALVKLTREVKFNDRIRPACLWTNINFNMSSVVASGFGRTSNDNDLMSPKLMKVKLNVLDGEECTKKFKFDQKLENGLMIADQLCVGSQNNGKDTCKGDSGGPLQVALDAETCIYHVVGLTSFGSHSCGIGNSEAVYTRVASYLDWIEQVVWGDFFG